MRINIRRRLILTGDDVLRWEHHGIAFSTRQEAPDQQYQFQIRGLHADWLREHGESVQMFQDKQLEEAWLEFKNDEVAVEFKLRFL
jgi:hypothetical protein